MFASLRVLALLAPVAVVIGLVWLGRQARELTYRNDGDLVVAVEKAPDRFNPLMPTTGVEREITELLFDRLLRLDDDLRLRPHLLERWEYRHRATCFFLDADKAAAAASRVDQVRDRWGDWGLIDFVLDGDQLHLVSSNPETGWLDEIVNGFDRESIAPLIHLRLTVKSEVARSLSDFLAGSVEKGQLRHLNYEGDRIADLYLLGETDLFLKELRLYYESNRNLEPEIEVMGPVHRLSELDFEMDLREDLRWHDGEPVGAEDLIFTFEEVTRPGSPWPLREAFGFVESLEKVDERRVRAHCRTFYAPALERWGKLPLLPAHRLRQAVGPEDWNQFFSHPVGTGPYRFESVNSEGELRLVSNGSYFRGAPRQEVVRYRIEPDPGRRRLDWRLGQIDMISPEPGERSWPFQDRRDGALEKPRADLVRDVGRFQSFVAWNLDRPKFVDPRVRRALGRLVDVDSLLGAIPGFDPMPWKGLFFPGSWFCEDSPGPFPPDPELAAALLREAGWKRSETGEWCAEGDAPVELTLSYDAGDSLHSGLAEKVADQWRRSGIGVRLEPLDWGRLIEERLAPRAFDALLLGWELDFSRDHFAVWHSSEAGPGGSNFSGLRNQEVDALLEKLRRERDEAIVIETATELQRQIRELQPCLFLCNTGREIALRSDAIVQARPGEDGTWQQGPVVVGRAGLYASRPWWGRRSELSSPAEAREAAAESTNP